MTPGPPLLDVRPHHIDDAAHRRLRDVEGVAPGELQQRVRPEYKPLGADGAAHANVDALLLQQQLHHRLAPDQARRKQRRADEAASGPGHARLPVHVHARIQQSARHAHVPRVHRGHQRRHTVPAAIAAVAIPRVHVRAEVDQQANAPEARGAARHGERGAAAVTDGRVDAHAAVLDEPLRRAREVEGGRDEELALGVGERVERRGRAGLGEDALAVHALELGEGHLGERLQVLVDRAALLVALRPLRVRLPLPEALEHVLLARCVHSRPADGPRGPSAGARCVCEGEN